jgi:hypothetical protein
MINVQQDHLIEIQIDQKDQAVMINVQQDHLIEIRTDQKDQENLDQEIKEKVVLSLDQIEDNESY